MRVFFFFLQIFLRVAEETGVDAEPEQQAESSNGPQTTAARRQAEDAQEDTGTGSHSRPAVSEHAQSCAAWCRAILHVHLPLCASKMLPGRKRQSKRGIVRSIFSFAEIKCLLWFKAEQDFFSIFTFFSIALKFFSRLLQNLWRRIRSVETAEVVSPWLAGGWPGSSSGLSSSSVGFMLAEAAGAS